MLKDGLAEADISGCDESVEASLAAAESAALAAPPPDVSDIALGTAEWMEWER
jgi:hypothetical protein